VHTEDLHMQRLHSLCRICGRRSQTCKVKNAPKLCKYYASHMYKLHDIHVSEEENGTKYSKTLCSSCCSRMCKLYSHDKETNPSLSLLKVACDDFNNSKGLWTEYNSTIDVSDCSVCQRFAEQSAGRRAIRIKASKKATIQ
jgi:hypothetical protein